MEKDNSKINKKRLNIDHNNTSSYKTKNESDQIKAAKIGVKGTIIASILGVLGTIGGIFLGGILESNRGKTIINQTFYEMASNEDGNITLDEVKQDYLTLKRDYEISSDENQILNGEKENLSNRLKDADNTIKELQAQLTNKNQEIEALNGTLSSMYDVDFQNLSLTINGIESGYIDRTVTINNETFYSLGFMKYIIDNQAVSSDGTKLFIGKVQSESQMPISLFSLDPFTPGSRYTKETNMKDNYDNIYEEVFKIRTIKKISSKPLDYAIEYYLDYQYSLFSFDMFYAKDADQNMEYEIIVYGDGRQLKTYSIDRKSKIEHIEVDVSGIEFLQIVGRSEDAYDYCYFGITNPYLYP